MKHNRLQAFTVEPLETRLQLNATVAQLQLTHRSGDLPNAYYYTDDLVVGDKVIFYPPSGQQPGSPAEIYDGTTGQWSSHAILDDWDNVQALGYRVIFNEGAELDIYNTRTNQWATTAAPQSYTQFMFAAVGTKVLLAGGYEQGTVTDAVQIFDVKTGVWSTEHLSVARQVDAATVAGPYAIFAGGYQLNQSDTAYVYSNVADLYDSRTGQWSTAQLSGPRVGMTAGSDGNYAFFAGGDKADGAKSGRVDIFNALTGRWTKSQISVGDFYTFATVGTTICFGDYDTGEADVLNLATAEETNRVLPPSFAYGFSVSSVSTKAFYVSNAAFELPGTPPPPQENVEIYDTITRAWSQLHLPQQREYSAVAGVGDKILIAGGDFYLPANGRDKTSSEVNVFNVDTNQLFTTEMDVARTNTTGAAAGEATVFFAGDADDVYSGANGEADIYTDTDPVAEPVGTIVGRRRADIANVAMTNTGDASLAAGSVVKVYASTNDTLNKSDVLLGSVKLTQAVAPGDSISMDVPLKIPNSLPRGNYHLLAAVSGPGRSNIAFASSEQTFFARGGLK